MLKGVNWLYFMESLITGRDGVGAARSHVSTFNCLVLIVTVFSTIKTSSKLELCIRRNA